MKFRNKNNGEIFLSFKDDFCLRMDNCNFCPIASKVKGGSCECWVNENPQEAADLMGYEIIFDGVHTKSSIGNKRGDAKSDEGKPRPTLVPVSLMEAVTAIREYGCAKYHDPENWRRVEPQRYRDALYRHWLAYLKGEKNDLESGLPHLWHLACNVAFLIEMEHEGKDGKDN